MKHPLLTVALLYAAGIILGDRVALSPWVLLGAGLVLAAVTFAWARARPVLLWLLVFLAGWTNLALRTAILSPIDLRLLLRDQAAIVSVRGRLRDTPLLRVYEQREKESWRALAQIDVTALSTNHQPWQPAAGRLAVTTPGLLTNFFAGQTVEIEGVAAVPEGALAEGTFDYRAYLRELGIYYHLRAASEADWRVLRSPPARPLADRFRAWARRALARGLPVEDESLRLEWALTLGWKTALTEEVAEPFVQAATYHIFAVDGLRMAIIFGIFFGLFRALGLPRPIGGLLLIPLIWFYVALTGWPASAIRASVMLTVVIGSWVLKRPSDLLNSLFAAALIILTWQPQQMFQAGFQLSFLVVLCIILMLPPLRVFTERLFAPDPLLPEALQPRWRRVLRSPARYAGDVLLTSFAAWIGALPLVAYYFHIFSPVSTPANLLAVPLCGLVLVSNLASLLLAGWFPAAAELFNHAGWFLMECIRVTSHWFAHWPAAYCYVAAPGLFTTVLYYAVLLALVTGWLFRRQTEQGMAEAGDSREKAQKTQRGKAATEEVTAEHAEYAEKKDSDLPDSAYSAYSAVYSSPQNPRPQRTSWTIAAQRMAWYCALLAPLAPFRGKGQIRLRPGRTALLVLAIGCWGWHGWRDASLTRLAVLPLYGGHALYFDAPGTKDDLLIDCGATNSLKFLTKPFLRAQGVNRLAGFLLTHGDSHHIGAAQMAAALFPPKHVWTSPVRFRSPGYRRAVQNFGRTPGKLRTLSRGGRLGPWTILHPEANDRFPQADDNSLVMLANLHGTRVLLLADLGRPGQNALLERGADLRADIVITGLPSASEAVSDAFLDAIRPRLIIVADSEYPVANRASPRLRERLGLRGIPVVYTRFAGAAMLEFRGRAWKLRTMRGAEMPDEKPVPPAAGLTTGEAGDGQE